MNLRIDVQETDKVRLINGEEEYRVDAELLWELVDVR